MLRDVNEKFIVNEHRLLFLSPGIHSGGCFVVYIRTECVSERTKQK